VPASLHLLDAHCLTEAAPHSDYLFLGVVDKFTYLLTPLPSPSSLWDIDACAFDARPVAPFQNPSLTEISLV